MDYCYNIEVFFKHNRDEEYLYPWLCKECISIEIIYSVILSNFQFYKRTQIKFIQKILAVLQGLPIRKGQDCTNILYGKIYSQEVNSILWIL